jgi:uncharacterized membrane protein
VSVTIRSQPHPAHAFLAGATVPSFLGAALADYAYYSSSQVQWINFASWLIVGGLTFGAVALVCGALGLRRRGSATPALAGFLVLLAMWILGVFNALIHARDAWASMPTGLVLSTLVALLSAVAAWLCFASLRPGGTP